jgi:hypothetical protein
VAAVDDWWRIRPVRCAPRGNAGIPARLRPARPGSAVRPVHLGNLRELMVPHLVADELRRQGAPCRHILS